MGACSSCLGRDRDHELSDEVGVFTKERRSHADMMEFVGWENSIIWWCSWRTIWKLWRTGQQSSANRSPRSTARDGSSPKGGGADFKVRVPSSFSIWPSIVAHSFLQALTDTFLCSHLVDIFAMVSQNPPMANHSILPVHDARFLRYQGVLAKMNAHDPSNLAKIQTNDNTPSASEGWISGEDDVEEMKGSRPVKSHGIGPLLGGFADADAAAVEWTWKIGPHHLCIMSYGVFASIAVTISSRWHVECSNYKMDVWILRYDWTQLGVIEVCVVSFWNSLCQKRLLTGCWIPGRTYHVALTLSAVRLHEGPLKHSHVRKFTSHHTFCFFSSLIKLASCPFLLNFSLDGLFIWGKWFLQLVWGMLALCVYLIPWLILAQGAYQKPRQPTIVFKQQYIILSAEFFYHQLIFIRSIIIWSWSSFYDSNHNDQNLLDVCTIITSMLSAGWRPLIFYRYVFNLEIKIGEGYYLGSSSRFIITRYAIGPHALYIRQP